MAGPERFVTILDLKNDKSLGEIDLKNRIDKISPDGTLMVVSCCDSNSKLGPAMA